MISDMRSAFANMLHHTLFEKQGPPQGKSTSIIEGSKLDYGSLECFLSFTFQAKFTMQR